MTRRSMVAVSLVVAAGMLVGGAVLLAGSPELPEKWQKWLDEEVYPLITREQRKAFLALETDEQRTAFVDRLWELWNAESGEGSNFRRTWEERLDEARAAFGSTTEDRSRLWLLHGAPDGRKAVNCDRIFHPMEFWIWGYLPGLGENVTVLFFRPYGVGRFRLWDPNIDSRMALYTTEGNMALQQYFTSSVRQYELSRPEYICGSDVLRLIGAAEFTMKDLEVRKAMERVQPPVGQVTGKESAAQRFLEFSTITPKDAKPLAFDLASEVGERNAGKIRVTFSGKVQRGELGSTKVGDLDVVQLDVTGEISREGQMDDRFRYSFSYPGDAPELPLQFDRELRPGTYRLRLKVADANSKHAGVKELDFLVEAAEVPTPSPEQLAAEKTLVRIASSPLPTLSLQGPEGEGVTGIQRFTALAGPQVVKVEFYLDNRLILAKNRPPFEIELDLGPVPRLASVVAVAYDPKGVELDRRQLDVNLGRERYFVRLQPVGSSDRKGGKVRAQAAVNVPTDRKLTKLELYWNEALVATLYEPPFDAWLPVQDDGSIGYLRALAVLDDGEQAEDVRFVNAGQFLSDVQVQTVELPVTVLDKDGQPVEGLTLADFQVLEDGRPQTISHFSRQQELPIRMGILVDTSGSMEETLPEVQRVVLGFLRNLLRPKDRAFVVSFSDRPALLEKFTADFGGLERAMIALRADRGTAFNDATVYGLFQFSGVRGRKAMVVLTDGEDNASRMSYDRVLDYAQRSGVTIYVVAIDLALTKVMVRSQLSRLARTTGGEVFFLSSNADLKKVYETINRELRTQYLVAYTSDATTPADVFRKITLKVLKPGLEVRTLAGYYPGG